MKTIRFTDNLARRWLFRHPINGNITVTLPEGAVRLDDDGYAEWDDILRLLSA